MNEQQDIEEIIDDRSVKPSMRLMVTADDRLTHNIEGHGMPLCVPTFRLCWRMVQLVSDKFPGGALATINEDVGPLIRCSLLAYRFLQKEWLQKYTDSVAGGRNDVNPNPCAAFHICSTKRYDFICGSWTHRPMIEVVESSIGSVAQVSHRYMNAAYEDCQIMGRSPENCITLRVKRVES